MNNLNGQVAIVTGGATGIGYGIAKRLGEDGANIIVVDYDQKLTEQSVSELASKGVKTDFILGDVSDEKTAKQALSMAIKLWDQVDILINNAGIGGRNGTIWELDVNELDRVYQTNLRGVFSFCHEIIPHMMEREYGRVVNIASVAG